MDWAWRVITAGAALVVVTSVFLAGWTCGAGDWGNFAVFCVTAFSSSMTVLMMWSSR